MRTITAMSSRLLKAVATRGRILAMSAVGGLGILVAFLLNANVDSRDFRPAEFISNFGLTIFVPLVVLVVSAATLGVLREERTLVYFWLRPIGRWQITVAALLVSAVVLVPLVLIPLVVMGTVVGDSTVATGAILAGTLGVVAYGSLFTMLGLFTQRALLWGLAYILVWEGFVAGLSRSAGWLAIRTYTSSALAQITDTPVINAPAQTSTAVIVALAVAAVCFVITTWRLNHMEVD